MNLDELRGGLTTLADEMEPFEGNVARCTAANADGGWRCRRLLR